MIKDLSLALDPIFQKRIKIKSKKREKRLFFFFIMLTINDKTNLRDRRKEENKLCITILRFRNISNEVLFKAVLWSRVDRFSTFL